MSEHIFMVSFLGQHIAIAFDFFSWLAHCHCHDKPIAMTMTMMWKVVLVVDRGLCNQIFGACNQTTSICQLEQQNQSSYQFQPDCYKMWVQHPLAKMEL
jgi:hypothetical protein